MNCDICKKSFTGIECYNAHVVSEKHRKKVLLHKSSISSEPVGGRIQNENLASSYPCSTCNLNFNSLPAFLQHSATEDHALMILKDAHPCTICSLNFSTLSELLEHSSTEDHARMILKNRQAKPIQNDFNDSEENLKPDSNIKEVDNCDSSTPENSNTVLPLNEFKSWLPRCEKCDKNFSGPESYQQHIASDKHKKKCSSVPTNVIHKEASASSTDFGEIPKENMTARNLLGVLKCEICDKTFSGPIPYEGHLRSEIHKKVADRKFYLEKYAAKENISVDSICKVEPSEKPEDLVKLSPWYCSVCKVLCSGIEPYKQHLAGKDHKKKVVRDEANSKRNDLQNLFSTEASFFENSNQTSLQVAKPAEMDKQNRSENIMARDLGQEIKYSLYGDSFDTKTCTPSDLDLTFFDIGEEIDFDKNSKSKVEVRDLDLMDVDVKEEDEDMEK